MQFKNLMFSCLIIEKLLIIFYNYFMFKEIIVQIINKVFASPLLASYFTGVVCLFFIVLLVIQKIRFMKQIKKERSDAITRSRSVLNGQMVEQIAPFLPNFPCNAGDLRFIGKPVDFIGFTGMAEGKPVEEVLLIEVKTGSSVLSGREKEIKRAVEEGRVRYLEYKL